VLHPCVSDNYNAKSRPNNGSKPDFAASCSIENR
jgi:hypothetical protein